MGGAERGAHTRSAPGRGHGEAGAGRPASVGDGPLDHACASCLRALCTGILPDDLAGPVLRCGCGQVSRVPAP